MNKFLIALLVSASSLSVFSQTEVTEKEIEGHIKFLASEKNGGRYPGTKANKRVVKYIIKDFKSSGIEAFDAGYKQRFKAKLDVEAGEPEKPLASTCNVIGFIEGNDAVLKNEYIVLGAHYDHLGFGGPSSKSEKKNAIHFGADDNASGIAALLEISEKIAAYKNELKRSVIFIAFGAEEQGLLGSIYFTEHPLVPIENIKLMINMDMVGRLNEKKQVYMGGAGTFPGGVDFMKDLGASLGLNPVVNSGDVGGSDHVLFYENGISVLGMHTGGHPQYHTPEDTLELINLPGEKMVCEYIFQTILKKALSTDTIYFINQD